MRNQNLGSWLCMPTHFHCPAPRPPPDSQTAPHCYFKCLLPHLLIITIMDSNHQSTYIITDDEGGQKNVMQVTISGPFKTLVIVYINHHLHPLIWVDQWQRCHLLACLTTFTEQLDVPPNLTTPTPRPIPDDDTATHQSHIQNIHHACCCTPPNLGIAEGAVTVIGFQPWLISLQLQLILRATFLPKAATSPNHHTVAFQCHSWLMPLQPQPITMSQPPNTTIIGRHHARMAHSMVILLKKKTGFQWEEIIKTRG